MEENGDRDAYVAPRPARSCLVQLCNVAWCTLGGGKEAVLRRRGNFRKPPARGATCAVSLSVFPCSLSLSASFGIRLARLFSTTGAQNGIHGRGIGSYLKGLVKDGVTSKR